MSKANKNVNDRRTARATGSRRPRRRDQTRDEVISAFPPPGPETKGCDSVAGTTEGAASIVTMHQDPIEEFCTVAANNLFRIYDEAEGGGNNEVRDAANE